MWGVHELDWTGLRKIMDQPKVFELTKKKKKNRVNPTQLNPKKFGVHEFGVFFFSFSSLRDLDNFSYYFSICKMNRLSFKRQDATNFHIVRECKVNHFSTNPFKMRFTFRFFVLSLQYLMHARAISGKIKERSEILRLSVSWLRWRTKTFRN